MAGKKPRRGNPRPIFDLIPKVNGFPRRHWIKFWIERWRSSPRVRATTYAQHGMWLDVVSYASENDGVLPFTQDELACTLGIPRRDRRSRFNKDLERLIEVGLLERIGDGTIIIPRFMDMQG